MIPDYQSIMLPALELFSDKKVKTAQEIVSSLAGSFGLTSEEREQLLPSGSLQTFNNRVGWALTYLRKAGLLAKPAKSKYEISPSGIDLLAKKPPRIDNKLLAGYPEFLPFFKGDSSNVAVMGIAATSLQAPLHSDVETPEDRIASALEELNAKLLDDIVDALHLVSWKLFERLVLRLLEAMGYGVSGSVLHVGGSGDQGVDGLINEDALGLDRIYVQAKKWQGPVGSPELQGFVGALAAKNARKGVFLTTSKFTSDAKSLANNVGAYSIALVDGQEIAKLMIRHNVGVQAASTFVVKRMDSEFFSEGAS